MEITLNDITNIEIKTVQYASRKGAHWITMILTDDKGIEHGVSIFPPHGGPDTIVTQTKRE